MKERPRHRAGVEQKQGPGFRLLTVQKIGSLLELFLPQAKIAGSAGSGRKLQDIARHLDWDDGTTHRFLSSLAEIGVLERTSNDDFSVGVLAVQLASVYISANQFRNAIIGEVAALSARTSLTVEVGALHGDAMVIVASRIGTMPLVSRSMLGERMPLHATAGGKAILAELSDERIRHLCGKDLLRLASNTHTTISALMDDIGDIRRNGLSRSRSEYAEGLSGVAVSIPARYFGSYPGALICSGPEVTSGLKWEDAESELRAVMTQLSKNLSQGLGYV